MNKAQKGYVFAVADNSSFYIPDALHVERDDELMLFGTDEAAAKSAECDGVKLIYGMEHVPDGVYLDTSENRAVIANALEKYPDYKDVPVYGRIRESADESPDMGMFLGKG